MPAPWSPMAAPPLPLRNDLEFNTCEHAYPAEECQCIVVTALAADEERPNE